MLHANEAFQRMCGYGLEDLRTAAHWQSLTAPEYLEVTFEAATRLARTGRTPPYEKQMIRPDGSRWWGLFAPTRVSGAGERSECMEFVVEISEQKRAREEEQARAAFAQQLMGIVSHDLRSPLTAILMSSEAALRRPEADERLRAALRRIHLLGTAGAPADPGPPGLTQAQLRGSIPIQRRRVELCSIVRQVADEVRQSHPAAT
jgi:PAS domain S-box-containing protein